MTNYRKKPVVIQAHPVSDPNRPDWLRDAIGTGTVFAALDGSMLIDTLEGTMRAEVTDWIIRGVKGELYPCKDDIFRATYQLADAPATPAAPGPLDRLDRLETLPVKKWRWSLRRDSLGDAVYYMVYLSDRRTTHEWNVTEDTLAAAVDAALRHVKAPQP